MLDHLSIQCRDVAASARFYDAVLAPLGGTRVMDFGEVIGYGLPPKPDFWIGPCNTGEGFRESHIAFSAPSRAAVDAFLAAAKAHGAEVLHDRACGPSTTRTTTARSCATPTATTSRRSVTHPSSAPKMFVMVGLPAAGKTTRARELAAAWSALRLTPDEWMIPLFGPEQPEGKRNVLEGRLIWLALDALRIGINVVLDFGVWGKDERSALRALAASVGATCELVYLHVDEDEQWRRVQARSVNDAATSFAMTTAELARWRDGFQAPDTTELETPGIDPPPAGFDSWAAWVAEWWPTSLSG